MLRLKKIAAPSCDGWIPWAVWVLVCTSALSARASEPTVLVLEDAAHRANSFFPALQIQLAGVAEPVRAGALAGSGAGERIERAGELVRANGALAAVWTERGRPADPVVLYVVGEREGRALVVVVRVPGARGPELERTLALKVREFVDEVRRDRARGIDASLITPVAPVQLPSPDNPAATLPNAPEPAEAPLQLVAATDTADAAPQWGALAFAGARLGSQPTVGLGRWGVAFGLGPELSLRSVRVAALLAVDMFPRTTTRLNGNQARYSELSLAGVLRGELRPGQVAVGAQLGLASVTLQADGTTRGGVNRSAEPSEFAVVAGTDLALPINETLSASVSVDVQVLAHRLTLAVNDAVLVDLGYVRARLGIGLVFRPFK